MADEDIRISFGADTGQVDSAISDVRDGVESLSPAADAAKSSFDDLKDTLVTAFSVDVIKNFVESMASLGTQIERMEVQFNMSGQQVQEWRQAMTATGGEVGNFSTAMTRLQANIDAAIEAPGRQRDAFAQLGITVGQLRQNYGDLNATSLLVADGFEKLHAQGGGISELLTLMGRGAANLAPLFAGGAEAVQALLNQFKEFTISDDVVGQLEAIHLQLTVMEAAFTQTGAVVVSDFRPAIDALLAGLTDLAKSLTDAFNTSDALKGGIVVLATAFDGLRIAIVSIVDAIRALADGALIFFDIMSSNTPAAQKHLEDMRKSFDDWNNSVKSTTTSLEQLYTTQSKGQSATGNSASGGKKGNGPAGTDGDTDDLGFDKQDIADDLALQEAYYEKSKALAEDDLAAGKITKQQEYAAEIQYLNDKHTAEEDALTEELGIYQKGTQEYQKTLDEKALLDVKYSTQVAQVQAKAALDANKSWTDSFKTINQAFEGMVQGILQGTETWQQALGKVFTDITAKFVQNTVLPMAEKWIGAQLNMTSAQEAGDAARTASTTAAAATAGATSAAASKGQVSNDAATAAANVYQSVSAIPYVGWLLAPPAAAAAFGAVEAFGSGIASFAVGSYSIPSDMPANVHAGEMIIPKTFADSIRSGEATLGSGGGGDNYNVTIQAVDSQSFANLVNSNSGVIVSAVQKSVRNANPQATGMMRS